MLIGYARVAKSEAHDTATQIDALRAAGCEKIFKEAPSGGRWDRPQLKRMLDELQAADVVVVQSLDRLAGSMTELVYVLEKIDKKGACFRSISESVDTSVPAGQMMIQMLCAIAGFDRAQLKQRTSEGQRAARARGNVGGRSAKLSPAQQREILEMLAAGRPAADLARLFRVHRATISRLATKAQRIDEPDLVEVR